MLTFYICYQHRTIKTDISPQEILMCPNSTFCWKNFYMWKNLRYFLLSCFFSFMYDSFTAQESPGGGHDSQGWLRAHTCPYYIRDLCSCSSGHLQSRADSGIQCQLPAVSRVFSIFQGWMHVVFQKEELWGAEVYTPFLQPVDVLAWLYYCSTLVVKSDFPICHPL